MLKTLIIVLVTFVSIQEELGQELAIIEKASQDISVHLPKSSAKNTTPQRRNRQKENQILDLESEIKQEEIRLQRAAPQRIKREKDIFQGDSDLNF